MNIIRAIRSMFGREPVAPKRRCTPGGMAWVKPYGQDYGADAIAGQAVQTVSLDAYGLWLVEPQLEYTISGTGTIVRFPSGCIACSGERVRASSIADECLEPWRDHDWSGEDESQAFYPKAPAVTPITSRESAGERAA